MTCADAHGAGCGNGQHARAAAEVEHAAHAALTRQLVDGQQAAERGAVVGRAERLPGVDQDGTRAVGDASAVVAAVHDEAAGDDGRQRGLRHGHPIEIGKVFKDDVGERPADPGRQRGGGGLGFGAILRIGLDPPGAGAVLEQRDGIESRVGRFEGVRDRLRHDEIGRAHRKLGAGHYLWSRAEAGRPRLMPRSRGCLRIPSPRH